MYGAFIVLTTAALRTLTLIHATEIVPDDPFARSLAVFIAAFWSARLAVSVFVFDAKEFLTTRWRRLG